MTRRELPADVAVLFDRGKLQQTCPDCGRWEAAHFYCSWCLRPTGPDDWYPNGDRTEHRRRMPVTAPASPPVEYRHAPRWPSTWGTFPFTRAVLTPQDEQDAT